MVNGHKICHGGYLFTLADSCFAFSCNTYNQRTVAHNCNITYVAPAFEGDTLTATGKEISRQGRRSEEHTSELQSRGHLVCRLLLEKKNQYVEQRGDRLQVR